MQKIFKYELSSPDCLIELTEDAEVLSVGVQNHLIVLWVTINPEHEKIQRRFRIVNTGMKVPDGGIFLGTATVRASGQDIVWHVFETTTRHRYDRQ